MSREPILSRHRLPWAYRISLVVLWLTPVGLLTITTLVGNGLSPHLLDPRFWLPLLLMTLPALYVWQEGVDVLTNGIVARVHWPRYHNYDRLETWYFDTRFGKRVITIWDADNRKLLECRAGHLTELPALLRAFKDHVRYRGWPR